MPDKTPADESTSPKAQVVQVIEMIKPFIQADGGDIEFVDFTDAGVVQVRLHGACVGCPGAQMTLTFGVEARLKEVVPAVTRVECVP